MAPEYGKEQGEVSKSQVNCGQWQEEDKVSPYPSITSFFWYVRALAFLLHPK
jgi:hypothetical protein